MNSEILTKKKLISESIYLNINNLLIYWIRKIFINLFSFKKNKYKIISFKRKIKDKKKKKIIIVN